MTDNRTRLLTIVTRELGSIVTTADDPLDAVLTTDLKGDSLHRISLICEIEEEFGIEVSDDDDAEWLADYGDYLHEQRRDRAAMSYVQAGAL